MYLTQEPITYLEYRVKPGDSLSMILAKLFNVGFGTNEYNRRVADIMELNPHISNPNSIIAGDLLVLKAETGPKICEVPEDKRSPLFAMPKPQILQSVPRESDPDFYVLSWLASNANYLTLPGSVAVGSQGNLLSGGEYSSARKSE